ncbi:MAG TPA: hypothetical protein VK524_32875 [Polyangiaceae bacterium]|nr:hypothetical protein [Polyangiaceae bacterium]
MRPFIPEEPDVPSEQRGEAELGVRFEDICQDGRLRIDGVWPPMGRILWNETRMGRIFTGLGKSGIRNVLARLTIHAEEVPISPRRRALSRVVYQLGHCVDEQGEVNRIVLRNWLLTEAVPAGSAPDAVQRRLIARAHGLHVFTRPNAPPGQHRVLSLEAPALPRVPEARVELPVAGELLQAPAGATFMDAVPRPDTAPLIFGLSHTDLNQHVNFLTYPRCIEDAALRRFVELEPGRRLLARSLEISYAKPCFAGDSMRVITQAWQLGSVRGVCAVFVPERDFSKDTSWDAFGRAHCIARLWMI